MCECVSGMMSTGEMRGSCCMTGLSLRAKSAHPRNLFLPIHIRHRNVLIEHKFSACGRVSDPKCSRSSSAVERKSPDFLCKNTVDSIWVNI